MRPSVTVHQEDRRGFVFHWKGRDGKRKQQQCHASSLQVARRMARELEERLCSEWGLTGDRTFEEFEDAYTQEKLSRNRARTIEKWDGVSKRFREFLKVRGLDPKHLLMREIDYRLFSEFEAWFYGLPNVKSANTVLTNMKAFRTGLNFAARNSWMAVLPPGGNVKEEPKETPEPIMDEEFRRLLGAVDVVFVKRLRKHWKAIISSYWEAGLRCSEPLDFRWRDPKYHRPVLDHDTPHIRWHRRQKNRKFQEVPITPKMVELIEGLERCNEFCFQVEGLNCRFKSRRSINEWFNKVATEAGVFRDDEPVTPQHLRQAFGFRMSRVLMPEDLRIVMRHSSVATTMKYYVGQSLKTTGDALAKLSKIDA